MEMEDSFLVITAMAMITGLIAILCITVWQDVQSQSGNESKHNYASVEYCIATQNTYSAYDKKGTCVVISISRGADDARTMEDIIGAHYIEFVKSRMPNKATLNESLTGETAMLNNKDK